MTHQVVMPHLGLTMEEGSVVSWRKNLGDHVTKGEVLFTVETDKAEMEVESGDSGFLKSIQVEIGQKVPVGALIATLEEDGAAGSSEVPPVTKGNGHAAQAVPVAAIAEVPVTHAGAGAPRSAVSSPSKFAASPRAKRLAHELGVDLSQVTPARGPRVVEEDVRKFHASRKEAAHVSAPAPEPVSAAPAPSHRTLSNRKIVAQRTSQSFHTAPHFYLGVEANATDLVRLREQLLEPCQQKVGVRLSFTDLFLRALAIAVKEHPEVNAYWHNDAIQARDSVDVAFAAQTAEDLVAPVIHQADALSLFELARQRHELTEKAKAGKLALAEMEGGSATLSNLGSTGVDWFQAILNPPQSVLLATGRIARRPTVVGEDLKVCPTVILSLSVDHRVLDGVAGANFLGRIKQLIESPSIMLV